METENSTLIWFRNDLRIHDNEALYKASEFDKCIAIYVFNENDFEQNQDGFKKLGKYRYNFILETLNDLKYNLSKFNIPLLIYKGNTKKILEQKINELNVSKVFMHTIPGIEEIGIENSITEFCKLKKVSINKYSSNTLIHFSDLKFTQFNFPKIFTQFRKNVESDFSIRKEFHDPKKTNSTEFFDFINSNNYLEEQSIQKYNHDLNFEGGETMGLKRLDYYLWQSNKIEVYKETRNGLIGMDYSTKFSAWLSVGAISPRRIFLEINKYEKEICKNESTYWVIFELLWRDYFNFYMHFFPLAYFRFKQNALNFYNENQKRNFANWKIGNTGIPFVDANMKELLTTGFMSNRGRQNVASYLINDLKINWYAGAKHFEEYLIDYDVASNYGNWCYLAGKGNDPRTNRYFNIEKQRQTYDPNNEYINLWNN
jgi:deoxyribodipyrimidine photo-lyase